VGPIGRAGARAAGNAFGFDVQADDPQAIDARKVVVDFLVLHLRTRSK
jgi:hypothetical protein